MSKYDKSFDIDDSSVFDWIESILHCVLYPICHIGKWTLLVLCLIATIYKCRCKICGGFKRFIIPEDHSDGIMEGLFPDACKILLPEWYCIRCNKF